MRAVVFKAAGAVAVEQRPDPIIEAPGDAIVRVTLAGVCGSDLAGYTGRHAREPGGMGHELVGIVEAVGSAVSRVKAGQRVVSPFSVACGGCFYCKQGLLSACDQRQIYGASRHGLGVRGRDAELLPGAQAEYVRVPNADATLERIDDALPDERALFLADLLTGVYMGLQSAGVKAGVSLAVLGCGPTGLAAVLLARSMGAGRIFAIDHHDYRLAAAAKLGAEPVDFDKAEVAAAVRDGTEGRGVDVAVEAVGTASALAQAVEMARPWGTVLNLGFGIEDAASFPVGRLAAQRIRLLPGYGPAVRNAMAPVARMMLRAGLDPTPLVSHTLPLAEAARAYDIMSSRTDGALKVLLRP